MTSRPAVPNRVREAVHAVLNGHGGRIFFTQHARRRMVERQFTQADVANVLRGGRYRFAEDQEEDTRYIAETTRYRVVFCLQSRGETVVVVITVIDTKR